METSQINDIWGKLDSKSGDEVWPCIITLRVFPESRYDIFLGLEARKNQRMLLIRILKENDPNPDNFPKSKGFELNKVIFPDDSQKFITIGLTLMDNQFQDIFTTLVKDTINHIIIENSEKLMIKSFILRLRVWQQFLDRYGCEGLTRSEQIGLFGELRFLNEYLIPLFGPRKAIVSWTGPEKAPQDFQISGMAVEIKTGSGKMDEKIHISNEQQLDNSGFKSLFLYYLSVKEFHDKINTLPNLVDRIKEQLTEDLIAKERFENLLIKSGYLEDHREIYAENAYSDRSAYFFLINEKFPCIIQNQLAPGIGNVTYTLNLSACLPFRISENEFKSKLTEID